MDDCAQAGRFDEFNPCFDASGARRAEFDALGPQAEYDGSITIDFVWSRYVDPTLSP